ncbi:hypothetical protein E4U44_001669 [Claviceps purpurea]|nr:hypothetical protein E4U44_001669 [Claviceps purpurea]
MSATTESDDTPCSDCENTRSERRVAEDLQRMSMNQTATHERRSAKLPDPAQLDDAVDPTYESWKGAISDKLSINEDWFTTEMARVAYVCSRTKGKALRHLDATRAAESDGSGALRTVSQILNHLDLIFLDPNRGSKARDDSLLRMTHTGFQDENLKEEFYKKLPQEFQSHLFGDYRDKGVILAQLADAAAEYDPISSWTRASTKTEKGRASGTTSAATAPKKAQPANPAPRQLPPDLQKLKEFGACYKCKQRGHIARDCPQKPGVSVVTQSSEVSRATEVGESGNEEA